MEAVKLARRPLSVLAALAALAALATIGCVRPRPEAPPDVEQVEWSVSRARLASLRDSESLRPYTERIRVAIHDPMTGKEYHARGAVAVSPKQAARMMLVGPGGTTALDLWVTKDKYRFSVPAIHLERRGGRSTADEGADASLPIGMLRWWFLSPLDGRLLLGRSSATESAWVIRDGAATVMVRTDGRTFTAVRRERDKLEGIEWTKPKGAPAGLGLHPIAGARGHYVEARYGLRVDVLVEELMDAEPDPAAFDDPDAEEATSL